MTPHPAAPEAEPALARVHDAQGDLDEARRAVKAAEAERAQSVQVALLHGVSAVQLAEALDVSRARVYQIRDGTR